MVKHQKLEKALTALNLTNRKLVDKLSDIINNNFEVKEADPAQKRLSVAKVTKWIQGTARPTDPIIRQGISFLLTESKDKTGDLDKYGCFIVPTKKEATKILYEALLKYNQEIIDNFKTFKLKCASGEYDKTKLNPYSTKTKPETIMGCIAYLLIQGYLFTDFSHAKGHLTLDNYSRIVDIDSLVNQTNIDNLLLNLQIYCNTAKKFDTGNIQTQALLFLLKQIAHQEFWL